jgi:SAM-dependent methyltransferase
MTGVERAGAEPAACVSCGADGLSVLGAIPWSVSSSSFVGQERDRPVAGGTLYRCRGCSLAFKWPRRPQDEINADHAEGDLVEWDDTFQAREDWRLAADFVSRLGSRRTVLDVGCFDGQFLAQFGDGWGKYGVEVHPQAAARARSRGVRIVGEDLARDLEKIDDRFEAVVAFDVIEHVPDPLELLGWMSSLASPGGYVLLSSGNTDAPSWRFMGSRYWYCTLPAHISFISPRWCRFAARKLGLEVVQVTPFAHVARRTAAREARDWVKNAVYKFAPGIARSLRRRGMGAMDVATHAELADSPPCFGYARDHIFVAFRRPVDV